MRDKQVLLHSHYEITEEPIMHTMVNPLLAHSENQAL